MKLHRLGFNEMGSLSVGDKVIVTKTVGGFDRKIRPLGKAVVVAKSTRTLTLDDGSRWNFHNRLYGGSGYRGGLDPYLCKWDDKIDDEIKRLALVDRLNSLIKISFDEANAEHLQIVIDLIEVLLMLIDMKKFK